LGIVGTILETVDKMTDRQVTAKVRELSTNKLASSIIGMDQETESEGLSSGSYQSHPATVARELLANSLEVSQ
jgi:hypothetical protein